MGKLNDRMKGDLLLKAYSPHPTELSPRGSTISQAWLPPRAS